MELDVNLDELHVDLVEKSRRIIDLCKEAACKDHRIARFKEEVQTLLSKSKYQDDKIATLVNECKEKCKMIYSLQSNINEMTEISEENKEEFQIDRDPESEWEKQVNEDDLISRDTNDETTILEKVNKR